jgi:predicted metal-dependent phosphoesterase TrpH
VKVDLHVHTTYSSDSLTIPEDAVRWAQKRGLDALAITDHNTIQGALHVQAVSSLPIIIGEEIRTVSGEIIGLFLEQEIPPDLSAVETVAAIHQQNGIVYVPHPLDRVRSSAIGFNGLIEIIDHVDVVETLNARITFSADNRLASDLAQAYRLHAAAGSDAHQSFEIGQAYTEMPAFQDRDSFWTALAHARTRGRISSPLVHVGSTCARAAKELRALTLTAK